MRPTTLTLATAAATLALLSAGCGSSGADGPTRAAFIHRADAICNQIDQRQREARSYFWKTHPGVLHTPQFKEEFVGWKTDVVEAAILPPIQEGAEELDRLRTPSGDKKELKAIVKELEKAVRVGQAHPVPLIKKNAVGPFGEVMKMARRYGFKACAEPL